MDDILAGVLTWMAVATLVALWTVLILAAFGIIEIGPIHIVVHTP